MTAVMQGVRILEVAEQTFVPASSAMLADLGAEVIKIEHVERGDAMRGLASTGVIALGGDVHALFEHSNRGKRSLGLDLTCDEGRDLLYKLASTADIFLTNKLPSVRQKLKIDEDDIRAHNPQIIYVRGHGQGARGPEADKGAYDSLAFWARSGIAVASTQPDDEHLQHQPGPGFGDSLGALALANGMSAALFHRERTGEGVAVDVSLMGTAMWAMGQAIAASLLSGTPWLPPPHDRPRPNPLVGNFLTKDGRWVAICCLQAGHYWPSMCEVLGKPELANDPRFADHHSLLAHSDDAIAILNEAFAQHTVDEWRDKLASFAGQWTVVQDTLEVARDPQTVANDYVLDCVTEDGKPFQLVTPPVQFGEEAAKPKRAPAFNEHGDAILTELGLDWDTIVDLKVKGVVT